MSGGHFDYAQYKIDDIVSQLERELERSGTEIPIKQRWNTDAEYYEKYPEDKFYPSYDYEIVEKFKEAIQILKKAAIYAQRIDLYLSGDDGEESFLRRLNDDLSDLESKFKNENHINEILRYKK